MQSTTINPNAAFPTETPVLRRPTARPGAFYNLAETVGRCAHCRRTIDRYTGEWTHFDGPACDPKEVAELDADRIETTLRELRVENMRQALKFAHRNLAEGWSPEDSAQMAAREVVELDARFEQQLAELGISRDA